MAQKKAALACSVCGSRNYTITLGQNRRVERLEIKKILQVLQQTNTTSRKQNKKEEEIRNAFFIKCD